LPLSHRLQKATRIEHHPAGIKSDIPTLHFCDYYHATLDLTEQSADLASPITPKLKIISAEEAMVDYI